VERAVQAFERMYREADVSLAADVLHPDLVVDFSQSIGPYRGIYRGIAQGEELFQTFAESFGAISWSAAKVHELGHRAALAPTMTVRGEGSGIETTSQAGQILTFEGERVREIKLLQSWDEALLELRRRRLAEARLYFVCDAIAGVDEVLEGALEGGADIVQLREKSPRCAEELISFADPFRRAAARHGALFFINDRPDLVQAVQADGVHVGQDDDPVAAARAQAGAATLVGLSTHSPAQLDAALAARGLALPDYVSVGPVWETPTKAGRPAAGIGYVSYAAERAALPWFAIGGIDATNLHEVAAAGAQRAVVVRAIRDAPDAAAAARELAGALADASGNEKPSLSEVNS
jgi:thiamine-phosphate pyrophosphorylase